MWAIKIVINFQKIGPILKFTQAYIFQVHILIQFNPLTES